jgi:UDP-3-O-[3-hydroxymyristoyl] glucosamine N-acyltransferase
MNRFFSRPTALTVREIVVLTGAVPRGAVRLDGAISGIAALDRARPSDLTFIDSAKHVDGLMATRAGVCLATAQFAERVPAALAVLVTAEPFRDFVTVARKLYPDALRPRSLFGSQAVAPGAIVHPSAEIEDGVIVDPGAVIGPGAAIGAGTVIAAAAVIGPNVQIGRGCSVGPGVSIVHALIGDGVILRAGCRVGQDGLRHHIKVPHVGRVIIQDHVEIGANTTIDIGGSGDTVIGEGTRIDNLVQIGPNVTVGRHCIIVAQCGLSGGVTLGDHVVLAGQVVVAEHLTIGEGARLPGVS